MIGSGETNHENGKVTVMRLHSFQHVPFEDLAEIGVWAEDKGFAVSHTRFFAGELPPSVDDVDWLVVMGGPMGVHDDFMYPWLGAEKEFIGRAVAAGKVVIGVCLGAQLMSHVLGGTVSKNPYREIGWYDVSLTSRGAGSALFGPLGLRFTAFHWHGDTFTAPPGAIRVAESVGCANQAFEYGDGRVVGLQFHLESTSASVRRLVDNCGDELSAAPFVQESERMLENPDRFTEANRIMRLLLDGVYRKFSV